MISLPQPSFGDHIAHDLLFRVGVVNRNSDTAKNTVISPNFLV